MNIRTITISGLDGSGKSTQINLLKKYLESRGKKVFYFHAVGFSVGNRIFEMLRSCHSERSEESRLNNTSDNYTRFPRRFAPRNDSKSVIHANWLKIQLRKIALRIDISRFKKLVKKLERQNYDFILSDRFFWDTIINIKYLELQRHSEHSKESRLNKSDDNFTGVLPCRQAVFASLHSVQNNLLAFYLKNSPEIIMKRERVPDQGLQYLKDKKKIYDRYFKNFTEAKIINGDRNKEEIFEEIKNHAITKYGE